MSRPSRPPPEECPVCGEPVPRRAIACPHCGADERSGWNEDDALYDGLDLPGSGDDEEDWDYEDFKEREFGGGGMKPQGVSWWWWLAALLVALAFLAWIF